jgi:hypothetical protein
MESIGTLFSYQPVTTNIVNERQFVLSEILEQINKERVGTKWKPMTGRGLAIKTSHLSLSDLKYHHYQCLKAESYGRLFFGLLKA